MVDSGLPAESAVSPAERLPQAPTGIAGFTAPPLGKPVKSLGGQYQSVDIKSVTLGEEEALDGVAGALLLVAVFERVVVEEDEPREREERDEERRGDVAKEDG